MFISYAFAPEKFSRNREGNTDLLLHFCDAFMLHRTLSEGPSPMASLW